MLTRSFIMTFSASIPCLLSALVLLGPPIAETGAGDSTWMADFETGSLDAWYWVRPDDWNRAVVADDAVLHLKTGGPIGSDPRRPVKFALFKQACLSDFELDVRLKKDVKEGESDLLIVFGYQDRTHFYYAHFSSDDGNVAVHNGIFKVGDRDRERIGGAGSAPALPDQEWHRVKVKRDLGAGSLEVYIDGEATPRFRAADRSMLCGRVGVGSFNDSGMFDDFRVAGRASEKCTPRVVDPVDGS